MRIKIFVLLCLISGISNGALADFNDDIFNVQQKWAEANYDTPSDNQKQAFKDLIAYARTLLLRYPDRAEPMVWLAISLSSDAGVNGGLKALGKVRESRRILLKAEKIDASVMQGSIYTSLGSLYYQVPGWPIGFGDDDKAERYLKKVLAINPQGIDPNFFYGDFLMESGHYKKAVVFLTRALLAPPRPGRALADAGRRNEIEVKLKGARSRAR